MMTLPGGGQQRRGQGGLGARGLWAEDLGRQTQLRDARLWDLGRGRGVNHDLDTNEFLVCWLIQNYFELGVG